MLTQDLHVADINQPTTNHTRLGMNNDMRYKRCTWPIRSLRYQRALENTRKQPNYWRTSNVPRHVNIVGLLNGTDVCGWTVGWIIKRYRNLVLATKKKSSRISLYDICFCEPISYSSYDIPRRENAHENTLPQLYVSHNCPSTTFIMSGSAQPVFTSMQLWREKTGCTWAVFVDEPTGRNL